MTVLGGSRAEIQTSRFVDRMLVSWPFDRSCCYSMKHPQAYILDLCSKFTPSSPLAPTADGSWRTHALSIERSYVELQGKYEAEQISTSYGPLSCDSFILTFLESLAAEQQVSSINKKNSKKKTSGMGPPEPEPRPDAPLTSVELKAILKRLHDRM